MDEGTSWSEDQEHGTLASQRQVHIWYAHQRFLQERLHVWVLDNLKFCDHKPLVDGMPEQAPYSYLTKQGHGEHHDEHDEDHDAHDVDHDARDVDPCVGHGVHGEGHGVHDASCGPYADIFPCSNEALKVGTHAPC